MSSVPHGRLVEQIYAAALAPDDWPNVVVSLCDALGGDHVLLRHFAVGASDTAQAVSVGLDAENLARFMACYPVLDNARPMGLSPALYTAGDVVSSADVLSDAEVERSFIYNEVIRPAKGFYSLTTMAPDVSSFTLSVCRSRAGGGFSDAQADGLRALLPHVGMALEMGHRLASGERRQAGWFALLERMSQGVILCGEGCDPTFINRQGLAVLAQMDGLDLTAGGLAGSNPVVTRQISEAIAAVSRGEVQGRRLALRRPSGRLPLMLNVLPVWRLGAQAGMDTRSSVAVFIQEPDAPAPIRAEVVADVFRLTTREAQIAVHLAGGLSPAEISVALGLTISTVRSHLKQIFSKMGVRTQASLVALVHSCGEVWS